MEGELEQERASRQAHAGMACPHGKVRHLEPCVECWESLLKESSRLASADKKNVIAKKVETSMPCMHMAERRRCKICKGAWICVHDLNKVYCKLCDGRRLCQVCMDVTLPRCYETCKNCQRKAGFSAALQAEGKPGTKEGKKGGKRKRI